MVKFGTFYKDMLQVRPGREKSRHSSVQMSVGNWGKAINNALAISVPSDPACTVRVVA